ncbi:MAG: sugar phosphate isomerase/epimerase, partial [Prosthecobacter sp.]|nr:sugar phosphate isomerase/epimerase [Prosthecobacter sp.]
MNSSHPFSRRQLLRHASLLTAGAMLPGVSKVFAAPAVPDALAGRIYKTLKFGMIKSGANLTEKFKIAKEAGFMGVEMGFPG